MKNLKIIKKGVGPKKKKFPVFTSDLDPTAKKSDRWCPSFFDLTYVMIDILLRALPYSNNHLKS